MVLVRLHMCVTPRKSKVSLARVPCGAHAALWHVAPDAEQRLKRASLAELERRAERVLTAKSLAAVLAD
jgi:hypothetical protein